jgi:ligand-binding SRPBCC domain-containing protein
MGYKLWRHKHRFLEWNGGALIADTVEYGVRSECLAGNTRAQQVQALLPRQPGELLVARRDAAGSR